MCVRSLSGALVGFVIAAAAASAQGPSATASAGATVIGTVRDTAGVPVARTRLSNSGFVTISDSVGRFTLAGLPAGTSTLLVRRLGFEPLDIALQLVGGRTDSVSLVMTMLPEKLPGMTTEVDALYRVRLADYYRHKQVGIGTFLDRKDIESKHVARLSDLMRRLPGTRITERGTRSTLRMGRSAGGRDCPPDMWIDGVRAYGMNVDDIPLGDVEALELYRGPAGLPPEMNNRLGNPACGALVIWTRLPG
jgi:hypothetical protein